MTENEIRSYADDCVRVLRRAKGEHSTWERRIARAYLTQVKLGRAGDIRLDSMPPVFPKDRRKTGRHTESNCMGGDTRAHDESSRDRVGGDPIGRRAGVADRRVS